MSIKKEKRKRTEKRRSDSDGVKVKRSYYSFSKYYPGGGSEQKYLRVMHETPDEHRTVKIILAVFTLFVAVFVGYFSMSVALNISDAPTTVETVTVPTTAPKTDSISDTTKPAKPTEEVTLEEPEREVNVTTTAPPENDITQNLEQ